MQQKRYDRTSEQTVGAGAVTQLIFRVQENRRSNFHGIRYQGRLRADNASADNEAHGLIIITCEPGGYPTLAEADVDSNANLEDRSEVLVAVLPWSVFGGSTNPVGGDTFFDWDLAIGTSRTCSKGAGIAGYVISMAESAKSVIVSHHLLSGFETTI